MSFPDLPPSARLWVYAASRLLTDDEQTALETRLEDFLADWTSHGRHVEGAAEVRDARFVLLAAHIPGGDVSGCGIDASVHVLEDAAQEMSLEWQSGLRIFYRDASGTVQSASRPAFATQAQEGDVTAATPVFDLTVETVAALREGQFEHPAGAGWHADAFDLPPAETADA